WIRRWGARRVPRATGSTPRGPRHGVHATGFMPRRSRHGVRPHPSPAFVYDPRTLGASSEDLLMPSTASIKAFALVALALVTLSAHAARYPEGYAEDRAQIVDLQARYVMAMDYFDAEGYAAVFAEDGVLDWARGLVEGRDAIYEFMASRTYDFTRGAA